MYYVIIILSSITILYLIASLIDSVIQPRRSGQDSFADFKDMPHEGSGVYAHNGTSWRKLPEWASPQYVQELCARCLIHAMNSASEQCFSVNLSAYEAYLAGEEWLILHNHYLNYIHLYNPYTDTSLRSSQQGIEARMNDLLESYKKEKSELATIRQNLIEYLSHTPHGFRKKAISSFVTKKQNTRKYYLYYSVFQEFYRTPFLDEYTENGSMYYVYIGGAVKQLLQLMQIKPIGRRKDLFKQLCPKKDSEERETYTSAFKFMETSGMIELGKDEKGFITYSLQSAIPRIAPCPDESKSNALAKIRQQEEYSINKALYFVNSPSYLDTTRQIADFTSLTNNEIYHTSLCACSCPAFDGSHSPCKHMIRLAIELNLFNPPGYQNRYSYKPELGYSLERFTNYL